MWSFDDYGKYSFTLIKMVDDKVIDGIVIKKGQAYLNLISIVWLVALLELKTRI